MQRWALASSVCSKMDAEDRGQSPARNAIIYGCLALLMFVRGPCKAEFGKGLQNIVNQFALIVGIVEPCNLITKSDKWVLDLQPSKGENPLLSNICYSICSWGSRNYEQCNHLIKQQLHLPRPGRLAIAECISGSSENDEHTKLSLHHIQNFPFITETPGRTWRTGGSQIAFGFGETMKEPERTSLKKTPSA